MRILIFDNNGKDGLNKDFLLNNTNNNLKQFIYIDLIKSLEDLEYYSLIRKYDLVIINVFNEDESNAHKKYLEAMKYLNDSKSKVDKNSTKVFFLFQNENKYFESFIQQHYKNVSTTFLCNATKDLIPQMINKYFNETPEIIKNIEIVNNQTDRFIEVTFRDNKKYKFEVTSRKSLFILLYFIRHYGETINIETILSGISEEPELNNTSPIETAISTLRKMFKKFTLPAQITSFKRVGYKFEI
jgi:DNA-binding winged helix-turn-helix (wHTH) protein